MDTPPPSTIFNSFLYTVKFLTLECSNQSSQLYFCAFLIRKEKRKLKNPSSEVIQCTERYLCTVKSHTSVEVIRFIIQVSVWKEVYCDKWGNNNFQNHIMCEFINSSFLCFIAFKWFQHQLQAFTFWSAIPLWIFYNWMGTNFPSLTAVTLMKFLIVYF
jgi:hypothetical protein